MMEKELEKAKRKTTLEMFKEIEMLEVADSPLMTVEDCLPFMCEKVEQALLELKQIKESKPSEALKSLEEMGKYSIGYGYVADLKQFETIKQTLVNFDLTIDFLIDLSKLTNETDLNKIMKKLQEQDKVLEIIFEKKVDTRFLRDCKTVEEYNKYCDDITDEKSLTEEEFDLLKRWSEK